MIPGLDGLRAIAFLAVLGFHTYNFHFGWTGVQLFFVLSGFLITGILLRLKENSKPKAYFRNFYGRRFLRIFPLYYFYLLLLIGVVLITNLLHFRLLQAQLGSKLWGQVWYAVFYVYNLYHASSRYQETLFLNPLWSLSTEEQFYILWPLILLLTPKNKLKSLFLGIIVLGPILRFIVSAMYGAHLFHFLGSDTPLAVYVLPTSHVDAFAVGAYISQFEIPRPRLQFALAWLFVPAIGYYTQYLTAGQVDWGTLGYDYLMPSLYKYIWGYSLLNYLFAISIYCVARTGLLTRLLDFPILRYLGKISYGLYVFHGAIVVSLERFDWPFPVRTPEFYLSALIITTLVASLSYHLLEKPILRLKDRYFDTHSLAAKHV